MAVFVAVDLWALQYMGTAEGHLALMRVQHELGLLAGWLALKLYGSLDNWRGRLPRWICTGWYLVMAIFFGTNAGLRVRDGRFETTAVYMGAMAAIVACTAYPVFGSLLHAYRTGTNRRLVVAHGLAFGALLAGGAADAATVWRMGLLQLPIPSFTALGVAAFILALSFSFVDRFAQILADRKNTLLELRNTYRELEAVLPLREVGQACAMVNHEISNNVFLITDSLNALLRLRGVSSRVRNVLSEARVNSERLRGLNRDAFRLSRTPFGAENAGEQRPTHE